MPPTQFEEQGEGVSEEDLGRVERRLRFRLPVVVRQFYLSTNGGVPSSYVYEDDNVDTVVSEVLPIMSHTGRRTAVDVYERLVVAKHLAPPHYLPFAVDGGGDYFFVDCDTQSGLVYFYRSDTVSNTDRLLPLGIGIDAFFGSLREE